MQRFGVIISCQPLLSMAEDWHVMVTLDFYVVTQLQSTWFYRCFGFSLAQLHRGHNSLLCLLNGRKYLHGCNFIVESVGNYSQILSLMRHKYVYLTIMQHLNQAYQKILNQSQKVGGTKHSLSDGGFKVSWGDRSQ